MTNTYLPQHSNTIENKSYGRLRAITLKATDCNWNVLHSEKFAMFVYACPSRNTHPRSYTLSRRLDALYHDCSKANWDGYNAKPACRSLRKTVEKFLNALPTTISDPEINADPDGEISLDWCEGPTKVFSISIGKRGRLSYAALDGQRKTHGVEFFQKDIPDNLIADLTTFLA
jgi:hypothetical protein